MTDMEKSGQKLSASDTLKIKEKTLGDRLDLGHKRGSLNES